MLVVGSNVAGFVMNRYDSQFDFDFYLVQPNGTIRHTLETVNAPSVTKIRGIEADLTVRPADGLSMNLSYAYTYWKVPPTANPRLFPDSLHKSMTRSGQASRHRSLTFVGAC